jgi:hypothetical protein
MSKWNRQVNRQIQPPQPTTINLAGGTAFDMSAELELVTILLSSFVQDKFYRGANAELARVKQLVDKLDPLFAAKAAIYARQEFGMRSITHMLAGELAAKIKGQPWAKDFYHKVIRRIDDMSEILAYYLNNYGTKKESTSVDKFGKPKKKKQDKMVLRAIPNAMKKGFAAAMSDYYTYPDGTPKRHPDGHPFKGQIAFKMDDNLVSKWKKDSAEISLVDIVNLVHPNQGKRGDFINNVWHRLVRGELKLSKETVENAMSRIGQVAETTEQKEQLSVEAWKNKLKDGSTSGYLNTIRNIRNMVNLNNSELTEMLIKAITDEKEIKKSVVMPFQFMTAIEEISKIGGTGKVMTALHQAVDMACQNVPNFPGRTLIAVDASGSMFPGWSHKEGSSPIDHASIMAAALYKRIENSDLIIFGTNAEYYSPAKTSSVADITSRIKARQFGGTNFPTVFDLASAHNIAYDRVFILSDMQSWQHGYNGVSDSFHAYKKRLGVNPKLYCYDLAGYGTLQFPEANVYTLAGFSEKVFDLVAQLEEDPKILLNKIKAIKL